MKVWLQTDKISGKIVAIRIDGKMAYKYNPEYIPYGVKNIAIEISDFIPIKGDHIIELITEKGDYIKAKFSI
ncbi:hypothetical protein GFS03_01440 [Sulfolobus sp. E5-1-F]|uniref:hypothetical protein n=1 Tax=Sulfolobaceae TaxID=118883 RepID=UPI001297918E|nr:MULTISPECIES: hypothetical protein [unclassified Sulfolobus]QGA53338.1 hypothetical protein GFS03_01440 [Sulfolobus sp. E5-1-F]QGA68446.1 hypothetical protein GFS33_06640 [Sulfolobus sp. E11-6]